MEVTMTLSNKCTTILSERLTFSSEEEARAFIELFRAIATTPQSRSEANDIQVADQQGEPLTLLRLLRSNRAHSLAEYSAMRSRQNRCPNCDSLEKKRETFLIFLIP